MAARFLHPRLPGLLNRHGDERKKVYLVFRSSVAAKQFPSNVFRRAVNTWGFHKTCSLNDALRWLDRMHACRQRCALFLEHINPGELRLQSVGEVTSKIQHVVLLARRRRQRQLLLKCQRESRLGDSYCSNIFCAAVFLLLLRADCSSSSLSTT